MYTNKLDDIVDEYNNRYHRTIKLKPVAVKSGNSIEYNINSSDKDPKFQVGDYVRISNIKIFLLKDILKIGLKNFLSLKKSKTLFHRDMLLVILMVETLLGHFMKKNCKKQIKKNLG